MHTTSDINVYKQKLTYRCVGIHMCKQLHKLWFWKTWDNAKLNIQII
jgi:hypothetical protein